MKKLAWLALCLGTIAIAVTASADKKSDPKATEKAAADAPAMDHEAMMKEWMAKYGTPSKEHKQLEYFAGNWSVTNTSWWEGPTPAVSTGTSHAELKMGGRYVHQTYDSEMGGMPFEGFGILGFDRVSGEYFNYWFDSMGTGCMEARGSASADGKSFELKASCKDPMMGPTMYRMTTTIADNDNYSFVMYSTPEGQKESKSMEIKYTRVKSS